MKWVVHCRVSGGVTGTREAILKANDVVQYFDTREAAQAEAARLNQKMNHAFSLAFFEYWPEEMEEAMTNWQPKVGDTVNVLNASRLPNVEQIKHTGTIESIDESADGSRIYWISGLAIGRSARVLRLVRRG